MYRLRDRNKQIPGGYQYYLPQTKWKPQPWSSLDSIAAQLLAHLQGNPDVAAKLKWPLDKAFLVGVVEQYNADLCAQMGWNDYLAVGRLPDPAPFSPPQPSQSGFLPRARHVVAGVETLVDWIASGAEAVTPALANARAAVCAACPLNQGGDLLSFFTMPVALAIRRAYSLRQQWRLETAFDEKLGVCGACDCVTKLLVHMPLAVKLAHMPAAAKAKLHPACWITAEEKGQTPK